MLCHCTDRSLWESAANTGDSEQDMRLHLLDNRHEIARVAAEVVPDELLLRVIELVSSVCCKHAVDIDDPEALNCFFAGDSEAHHRPDDRIADTDTRGTGTDAHNTLRTQVVHALALSKQCRHYTRCSHGSSALNVVVEGGVSVPVAVQQGEGMIGTEVLKLHKNSRPPVEDCRHELVDSIVVLLAFETLLWDAEVEGIIEEILIVGAEVKHHRQHA